MDLLLEFRRVLFRSPKLLPPNRALLSLPPIRPRFLANCAFSPQTIRSAPHFAGPLRRGRNRLFYRRTRLASPLPIIRPLKFLSNRRAGIASALPISWPPVSTAILIRATCIYSPEA